MRRCPVQKLTPHPAELEVEAEVEVEVEELRGVKEVRRNPRLLAQLDGEKSLEEFQSVQEPRLVEIIQICKQPLLERNQSCF